MPEEKVSRMPGRDDGICPHCVCYFDEVRGIKCRCTPAADAGPRQPVNCADPNHKSGSVFHADGGLCLLAGYEPSAANEPNIHDKLVMGWLVRNAKTPDEVKWASYPIGMVQRWIERAQEAEAKIGCAPPVPQEAAPDWEKMYRQELWETHAGCTHGAYLYGDDGEMQCNHRDCMLDFKRGDIAVLHAQIWQMNLKRGEQQTATAPDEAMRVAADKEAELIVANCACATQLPELRNDEHDTYRTIVLNVKSGLDRYAALIRQAGSEREREAFESCAKELREHYNSDWDSTVPGAEFDAEILRILRKHLGEASRLLGGESCREK